jgi:hypothetical protein
MGCLATVVKAVDLDQVFDTCVGSQWAGKDIGG